MSGLIVALDRPNADAALALVDELGDAVDFYKVGLELFTAAGPSLVRELRARERRVFLDLKLHDIPNTVAAAVRVAAQLDVQMLTLHATGGTAMIEAAARAAEDAQLTLLAVTLLTSFSADDIERVWDKQLRSVRDEVTRLAALAAEAGAHGVVASAQEAEPLRRRHAPPFLLVTPGIRPAGADAGDQSRTAAPADAVRAGADFLVVGRPIHEAPDPAAAARAVLAEMTLAEAEVA